MKKIYSVVMLCLFFLPGTSFSQSFKDLYFDEDIAAYKGALLKFNPKSFESGLKSSLYKELYTAGKSGESVAYPVKNDSTETNKDSLINRVFKVEKITNSSGVEVESYEKLERGDSPIFNLVDTASKERLYYIYRPRYKTNFIFHVLQVQWNKKILASEIERHVKGSPAQVMLSSPIGSADGYIMYDIIIYKNITSGVPRYYLSLKATGNSATGPGKGVTLFFTNGTKLSKPLEVVRVDPDGIGYNYNSFVRLTSDDLLALKSKTIEKFILYKHENIVSEVLADKFKIYVESIMLKK